MPEEERAPARRALQPGMTDQQDAGTVIKYELSIRRLLDGK
jgi:hypothetical protein